MIQNFKKILICGLIFCITFVICFGVPSSVKADELDTAPHLQLQIPTQPSFGKEITLTAIATNFKYDTDSQFTWCVKGKTYQSVQAGSEDKFVDKEGTLGNRYGILENASCGHLDEYDPGSWLCPFRKGPRIVGTTVSLYRRWKKDTNNNQIDDDWEIRYFGDLINNLGISPNDDSDGDGYNWNASFPKEDRKTGCSGIDIGVAEEEDFCNKGCKTTEGPDGKDQDFCACRAGAPCVKNPKTGKTYVTGDGKFTNYEEYVFGTNPRSADTDDDGIIDEEDVLGIGGDRAGFKIDKGVFEIGDKIPVGVTTYGRARDDIDWGDLKQMAAGAALGAVWAGLPGAIIGGLIAWLFKDWGEFNYTPLIAAEYIVVSPGPPLKVILISEPEVPTSANTGEDYPKVKIKAQITGAEKKERLYFKWYIGDKVKYEGYNQEEFEFSMTDPGIYNEPCNYNNITCDVSEEGTGRMGSAELRLEVGENITDLSAELIGTRAAEEGPVEDPCGLNVEVDKGFVRVGDIIKVHATLDFCKPPGNYPDSNGPEDFVYQWYLDGKEQINQTGAGDKPNPQIEGGTFQDFKFTVTKSPGNEHLVKLKLIRIFDGFEYGQLGEKVFTVQTPKAPISTPELGQPGSCDEIGPGGVCRVILEPGDTKTVTFKTVLNYFQPTYAPSFHYIWTFDGEVPRDEETGEVIGVNCGGEINQTEGYCESTIEESTLGFEFSHPGGIEEETIETHSVGLTAENYVYATGGPHETAMDIYTMEVVLKPGGAAVARGPLRTFFAQAGQAVSSHFKNIFNIVFTIGVIGFIVFVVMAAGQIKRKKE